MGTALLLQVAAFAWFALPRRAAAPVTAHGARGPMSMCLERMALTTTAYPAVGYRRIQHVRHVRKQCAHWRLAATASTSLCVGLAAVLFMAMSRPVVAIRVLEADRHVPVVAATIDDDRSMDNEQGAYVMLPTFTWPDPVAFPLRTIAAGLSR